ncbi:hypothetical protein [Sphaerisporangium sp. TRM90804]|uniref:hypothetical protein n=1 Tax=Sphaerisporangium sp. TRM90804 TaxID=3031113 RepID=UPI00244D7600|nr:hypothetical protein [Sphaerisporangium sp. TRM90804]MDH2429573.1 hypothetical protein [Sphaerisporangium sp. TRM90804]
MGILAVLAASTAPVLSAAVPANAAAAGALRITKIDCIERSDLFGADNPYFLVFIGNPGNPDLDTTVEVDPGISTDSGHTYIANTVISNSAQAGALTISVMLDQDDAKDLTAQEIQWIGNNMHNAWQIYFWKSKSERIAGLRSVLRSTVDSYLVNDDILGDSYATVVAGQTAVMPFTDDGGDYKVYYGDAPVS